MRPSARYSFRLDVSDVENKSRRLTGAVGKPADLKRDAAIRSEIGVACGVYGYGAGNRPTPSLGFDQNGSDAAISDYDTSSPTAEEHLDTSLGEHLVGQASQLEGINHGESARSGTALATVGPRCCPTCYEPLNDLSGYTEYDLPPLPVKASQAGESTSCGHAAGKTVSLDQHRAGAVAGSRNSRAQPRWAGPRNDDISFC
jgi:hypothetical protein